LTLPRKKEGRKKMSRLLKTALWTLAVLSGMAICAVVASAQTPPIYVLMCPLGHDGYTPRGDTMYHSEIACMDHSDATVQPGKRGGCKCAAFNEVKETCGLLPGKINDDPVGGITLPLPYQSNNNAGARRSVSPN
jgi:hypothetical protein